MGKKKDGGYYGNGAQPREKIPGSLLKDGFDFFFSLFLFCAVFVWLWPLITLAIVIDSPGPVFFQQERWGKKNKRIILYKFRSMIPQSQETDAKGNYLPTSRNDPRITRVGRFLRRTSLDELPQFWNVLRGDMSVVGPRPHPTPLNLEAKERVRHYLLRHRVKPGITGWAQVKGYRGTVPNSLIMQKRINHDLWYIENWSFGLDLRIIATSVWLILRGFPNAY